MQVENDSRDEHRQKTGGQFHWVEILSEVEMGSDASGSVERSDFTFSDCLENLKSGRSSLQQPNLPETKKVGGACGPAHSRNDDYGPVPTIVGIAGATVTTPVTPSGLQFEGSSCVAGWPAEMNEVGPSKSYSTQAWSNRPLLGALELKNSMLTQPTPNEGIDPEKSAMFRR